MTRVGKYMVYNPRKDKPVKYYDDLSYAEAQASLINDKEKSDILILKVIANVETKNYKVLRSEYRATKARKLAIIEDEQ